MSVIDYVGRTADILAFQGMFQAGKEELLSQTLVAPGTGGYLITGVEKLVQRVLVILLTRQGTMQYLPTAGTRFMLDAESGLWRTVLDVQNSFYSAKLDLMRQLRALQLATDPPDEVIDTVDLLNVILTTDTVKLFIRLVTQAGQPVNFIQPLPVVMR